MQTNSLIQASADVIRIVTLQPGDVYKRLPAADGYGTAKDDMRFGVVQDVLNNGVDTAITALEFANDYLAVRPEVKTFRGSTDMALFPATPGEVAGYLEELRKAARRAEETAEQDLIRRREARVAIEAAFGTASRGELTAATVEVVAVGATPRPSNSPPVHGR